ncbi:MAG TPA: N-6 DNA methylase, partial [Tepidisphaeraceae bacterium]
MRRRVFQAETLFGPEITERELLGIAKELGAEEVPGWGQSERALLRDLPRPGRTLVNEFRASILAGGDPMGDAFCEIRSREHRRQLGATYTPHLVVRAMLDWCTVHQPPARVVDPGCGSARFLLDAASRFPRASLVGIDVDPVASIIARGNLSAFNLAGRSEVKLLDFRDLKLHEQFSPTLFVGNPPYVRHHQIEPKWKHWLTQKARGLGLPVSQLCGLHLHFFLATALLAKPGDFGAYITAAEWMDVNYGELLRKLAIRQLGVRSVTVVEPTAQPFPNATTTACITSFLLGKPQKTISFYRVASAAALGKLPEPKRVSTERLESESRWSIFTTSGSRVPKGYVELGELCRVHRGQVTGANDVWIADPTVELPQQVLFPTVTRARELFAAGTRLADATRLRRVVDLPVDLDVLEKADRRLVDSFLVIAKAKGADRGYVAEKRRAWWSVGLRTPAPILCTYMARRPPAFVENDVHARHINIAHGLYPREPLAKTLIGRLVAF